jgi:hypothetical protein
LIFSVGTFDKSNHLSRTTSLIECAHRAGSKKLKRFVLLGSAVAVLNSFEDPSVAGKDYTEENWNPVLSFFRLLLTVLLILVKGIRFLRN